MPFSKIKKAIIPVAGLGTRMLPATKAIPKELLPIYDKPLIQIVVEEAIDAGISEIIFVTRSGKEAIENHFDKNFELEQHLKSSKKNKSLGTIQNYFDKNLKISSIRQTEPLGLGHAILSAEHIINKDPFAVILPDELLIEKSNENDLKKLITGYEKTGSAQILVEKILKKATSKYGIAETKNTKKIYKSFSVSRLLEKPKPENTNSRYRIIGRYAMPYKVMENLKSLKPGKDKEIQLTDAINRLLTDKKNNIDAIISSSKVYDCGSKKGFMGANLEIALKQSGMKKYLKGIIMD